MVKPGDRKKTVSINTGATGKNGANESPSTDSLVKKNEDTNMPSSSKHEFENRSKNKSSNSSRSSSQNMNERKLRLTIHSLHNLKPFTRRETAKVIVEFSDNVVVSTPKILLKHDGHNAVNWAVDMRCYAQSVEERRTFAKCPILFTLITESLNKEVKTVPRTPLAIDPTLSQQSREKVIQLKEEEEKRKRGQRKSEPIVFGYCSLDLMPLLLGRTRIKEEILVEQFRYSAGSNIITWPNLPRLWVSVNISKPLINPKDIRESNMLSITLESMYNLFPYMKRSLQYTAATAFPQQDGNTKVNFEMGCWTNQPDRDKTKRWNHLADIDGRGSYTKYTLGEGTVLKNPLDKEVPKIMDEALPRIEWNLMESCWLPDQGAELIFKYISKYRCWPLEILVTSNSFVSKVPIRRKQTGSKHKMFKTDSKRGISMREASAQMLKLSTNDLPTLPRGEAREVARLAAYFDVTNLLRPGETKVRALGQVFTYCQEDMMKRCGINEPLIDLRPKTEEPIVEPEVITVKNDPVPPSSTKKDKPDKIFARAPLKTVEEEPEDLPAEAAPVTNPFCLDGRSTPMLTNKGQPVFIVLELELWKPLTPKRSLTDTPLCIDDVLPKREGVPQHVMTATLASEHYARCIQTATELVISDYRKMREASLNGEGDVFIEQDLTREFYSHLITNGTYQIVKTTLRNKFALMIREYMGRGSRSSEEIQALLPDVYIHFMEEAKTILGSFIVGSQKPAPAELTNEQLRFFANEYAGEKECELALKLYRKTLANDVKNPDNWLQCAIFCVTYRTDEAFECVREALCLDSKNQIGILLYGLLLAGRDRNHDAEMCFTCLLSLYPDFLEGWVILHLFYLKLESHAAADAALEAARDCSYDLHYYSEELFRKALENASIGSENVSFLSEKSSIGTTASVNASVVSGRASPGMKETSIGSGKVGIGSDRSSVGLRKASRDSKKNSIVSEKGNISLNKGSISSRKESISSEKGSIGPDKGNIGSRKESIVSEKGNISLNKGIIGSRKDSIGSGKVGNGLDKGIIGSRRDSIGSEKEKVKFKPSQVSIDSKKGNVISNPTRTSIGSGIASIDSGKADIASEKVIIGSEKEKVTFSSQSVGIGSEKTGTASKNASIASERDVTGTKEITKDSSKLDVVPEEPESCSEKHETSEKIFQKTEFSSEYLNQKTDYGSEYLYNTSKETQNSKSEWPCIVTEFLDWIPNTYPHTSIFLTTTDLLLKLNSIFFTEFCLAQELIHTGVSRPYWYYLSVSHFKEHRYTDAISHLQPLSDPDLPDYPIHILIGHCKYKLREMQRAQTYYENADNHQRRVGNEHLVNLRLGQCYLTVKDYAMAKESFTKSSTDYATPKSWLGVAIACYKLGEYHDAEGALIDANRLDNGCPLVWAYMTLVSLRLRREEEFVECFLQMKRRDMQDDDLLSEIFLLQEELGYKVPGVNTTEPPGESFDGGRKRTSGKECGKPVRNA